MYRYVVLHGATINIRILSIAELNFIQAEHTINRNKLLLQQFRRFQEHEM